MFLDADDWVEADMLESLYRLAEVDHGIFRVMPLLREENQLEEKDNQSNLQLNVQLFMEKTETESGLALLTGVDPVACGRYRKDLIENIQSVLKSCSGRGLYCLTRMYLFR